MTDFLSSLRIAATGLHAQTARMRVIAHVLRDVGAAVRVPWSVAVETLATRMDVPLTGASRRSTRRWRTGARRRRRT